MRNGFTYRRLAGGTGLGAGARLDVVGLFVVDVGATLIGCCTTDCELTGREMPNAFCDGVDPNPIPPEGLTPIPMLVV